jgi:hypothetical protein
MLEAYPPNHPSSARGLHVSFTCWCVWITFHSFFLHRLCDRQSTAVRSDFSERVVSSWRVSYTCHLRWLPSDLFGVVLLVFFFPMFLCACYCKYLCCTNLPCSLCNGYETGVGGSPNSVNTFNDHLLVVVSRIRASKSLAHIFESIAIVYFHS